jgi:hypothetical protein
MVINGLMMMIEPRMIGVMAAVRECSDIIARLSATVALLAENAGKSARVRLAGIILALVTSW